MIVMIIPIDLDKIDSNSLDKLSECILEKLEPNLNSKFVSISQFREEFEAFKDEQSNINELLKDEQSKSLKETIDINREMNEMQNMYQQLYGELNTLKIDINDKINENQQKQEETLHSLFNEHDAKLSDKLTRNTVHS